VKDGKCCSGCGCGSKSDETIKDTVKAKYGQVAEAAKRHKETSCCGGGTSKDAITRDLYSEAEAANVPVEALLASMGCANPVALAELRPGEVVLDLGSGGGIDVLLSARRVGPTGRAYGLDMTDDMLDLARKNQQESGVSNVEFLKGEIESIPLPDGSVDVIISNCVINLSTDKDRVLREAFRVLRPGGRLAVADIVLTAPIPQGLQRHLELWAGCVAGALQVGEYKCKLSEAGFERAEVEVVRAYTAEDADGVIPQDVLREIEEERAAGLMGSIVSAFIRASKPKTSK
jgi:arsenite methyltransferase